MEFLGKGGFDLSRGVLRAYLYRLFNIHVLSLYATLRL